jgi:hypothetical protein
VKIIEILKKHRPVDESVLKKFIYENLPQEMIRGLEYDDPKAINRALKLVGIKETYVPSKDLYKIEDDASDSE